VIQAVHSNRDSCRRTGPVRAGLIALACVAALGLAACSGGSGKTAGGAGGDGSFQDTSNVADDRYLGGDPGPDGTGSVPHVEIVHDLPGGDPARDQVSGVSDLGG
jgi:hypothetical protein